MSGKKLTLAEWIDSEGTHTVAKLLKVNRSGVCHWKRGHCLPRSEQMFLIEKYSRGAVTCCEMIHTFYKSKKVG